MVGVESPRGAEGRHVSQSEFPAIVVGLGQMGMGYDYDEPSPGTILTHCHAFAEHPAFRLAAGVDPDPHRRADFERRYRIPAFPTIAALPQSSGDEVIALAASTPLHASLFESIAASRRPRAVICEKPMGGTVAEARAIAHASEERGIPVVVNYFRRFEPGAEDVREILAGSSFAGELKGTAWYSKGLVNNASHLIDLLRHWLGEVVGSEVISAGRNLAPFGPEPDFVLTFSRGRVVFQAAREEAYSLGELDLIADGGRLQYLDWGIRIRYSTVEPDPNFSGYRRLSSPTDVPTDFARYQWHVVDHLASFLRNDTPLASTAESALGTSRAIDAILVQL